MSQEETESIRTANTRGPVIESAATDPELRKKSRFGRELVETLLLTLVIFFGVRALVQSFRVDGRSMVPSLQPNELLLVNKAVYWHTDTDSPLTFVARDPSGSSEDRFVFHAPQKGDVIVFHAPQDPGKDYIKRVIGTPGDTIKIEDGKVLVNGQALQEPYIDDELTTGNDGFDFESQGQQPATEGGRCLPEESCWKVPDANLFVLGDNRDGSSDSRSWGYVPYDYVVGKAMFSYWPLGKLGGIPHSVVTFWLPWVF